MTHLERKIYILLWLFIGASVFTGTITAFAPEQETEYIHTIFDKLYFIGEQLCEILLLCIIYTQVKHYKLIYLLRALIGLSGCEMIDEILMLNFGGYSLSNYALLAGVLYVVYNQMRYVRNKRRSNSSV